MSEQRKAINHRIEVYPPKYYRMGLTETPVEFLERSAKDFEELVNQLYEGRDWRIRFTWDWEEE
jgi:hypothetical protein